MTCFNSVYMFSSLDEEAFFSQKVVIRRIYSNEDLKYHSFFTKLTDLPLEYLIIVKNFVFFFVDSRHYFNAKEKLKILRTKLKHKKILIIKMEKILSQFILSFFPDPYIHDLQFRADKKTGLKTINVHLLTYEERGIAIGRSGKYIKAVNEILSNYVLFEEYATFEKYKLPLKVRCELRVL